ncbi:MAG: GSCFA domain-containing protein [Dysgonamonadaceae bacterium]|jgi:hypothetical protein|nr:GSCFA domain-containing protein [Dysgonamonadaceae bacterium]
MDFRTRVHIPKSDISVCHFTQMMLFGSCFSENIGDKLLDYRFRANVNPFGVLYNPLSISQAIKLLLLGKQPVFGNDLIFHNEMYHSLMHHGDFSKTDKNHCLENISEQFSKSSDFIAKTDIFLITFGTAYVYRWKETGEVVGNCHKIPPDKFVRFRLTIDEIVEQWSDIISLIKSKNDKAKFLFTVSPIRHWKDGAHENQVSKSILHLAIDSLQSRFADVHYFPAYEILLDELRDYRFFAEDMMHPSSVAISYIWERFSETYFSDKTIEINQEWSHIYRAIHHKPINPETEAHKNFLEQTKLKMEEFYKRYPLISKQVDE